MLFDFYFRFYTGRISDEYSAKAILVNALILDLLVSVIFSVGVPAYKVVQGQMTVSMVAVLTTATIGVGAVVSTLLSINKCFAFIEKHYVKAIYGVAVGSFLNMLLSLVLPVWWHMFSNILFTLILLSCHEAITELKLIQLVSAEEFAEYSRVRRALATWASFGGTAIVVFLPIDFHQMVLYDCLMKLLMILTGIFVYRRGNYIMKKRGLV